MVGHVCLGRSAADGLLRPPEAPTHTPVFAVPLPLGFGSHRRFCVWFAFRIYLYFFLFGIIALGIGAWALVSVNPNAMTAAAAAAPTPLDPAQLANCDQINKFLSLFSLVYARANRDVFFDHNDIVS